jgi:hypothetical protein
MRLRRKAKVKMEKGEGEGKEAAVGSRQSPATTSNPESRIQNPVSSIQNPIRQSISINHNQSQFFFYPLLLRFFPT